MDNKANAALIDFLSYVVSNVVSGSAFVAAQSTTAASVEAAARQAVESAISTTKRARRNALKEL